MDIVDLRYLSASAEACNFARAARSLGLHTSTVSRRIGQLEDKLGLTLFERGRSGVRLTSGGRAVLAHVRRALAELDAIERTGRMNGTGKASEIRLGVRIPPIGEPFRTLLAVWRARHLDVLLTIFEMNERDMFIALSERRLDVVLISNHALWPHATAIPIYHERLVVALPFEHPLARDETISWVSLRNETFLVQGWDESQSARELYTSFLGSGVRFHVHAAGKQCVFALVGAGFGITLALEGQAEATFPGVVFRTIAEPDAKVQIVLAWLPDTEDAAVGCFVSFMRDEAHARCLL